MPGPAVELLHVRKTYREGDSERAVLSDVSVAIEPGEIAVLVGRSGLPASRSPPSRRCEVVGAIPQMLRCPGVPCHQTISSQRRAPSAGLTSATTLTIRKDAATASQP